MRTMVLIITGLLLSGVVAAKWPKSTPITRSALQKLLGTQAQAVLRSLSRGQVVITAVHEASPLESDFDLYMLPGVLFSHDERGITDAVKFAVDMHADNSGYIFAPMAGDAVRQWRYYYYTQNGLEWIKIVGLGEKINMSLSFYDVDFLSDDYSLEDALHNNRFYMERYTHEDQSSVRYLKELRAELNGKLSDELDVELRKHNLGEVLISSDYLSKIEALVSEADAAAQRRWQKALSALKAEIPAEELVVRLRKGEFKQEGITIEQVEAAERIVRLKDASIAKRNKDIHGQVHFYAFRIPHTYLHNLLNRYAKTNGLSNEQKQALLHRLFHEQEVNYKAVKFGQTDSRRNQAWQARVSELTAPEQEELSQILVKIMPEDKYQEIVKQTGIPRKQRSKAKSTPPSRKISDLAREIDLDSGKVEVRIEEQLRDIIDVNLLKKIGGDTNTLVKEAKMLAYAPPSNSSMLDKDILHYLFGGDVKAAQMVAGKHSTETVVFLHEGEELELSEDVVKLVRDSFKESVEQFGDYLDRRRRDNISHPRFSHYVRQHKKEKVAKPMTPLQQVWLDFFDAVRSNNERYSYFSNEALRQELGFVNAYKQTLKNQVITYMLFANIEASIKKTKLDDNIAKKLLQEFAVFTPVIANSVLMAAKLKRGGEEVLDIAMYYANTRKGVTNSKRENLTMIYRGLQELGDKEFSEYFENEIGADMWEKIQSNLQRKQLEELWQDFFDAVRSNNEGYRNFSNSELRQKLKKLQFAYWQTLNNQFITHMHFANIETAMEKEELDEAIAQELLQEFAAFTPVIANPVLMAAKLKRGGKEVLDIAIEYAKERGNTGQNTSQENLTMIYLGLQKLGNEELVEHFKNKIDKDMWEKIQSNPQRKQLEELWQDFFDAVRSNNEGYRNFSNSELRQKLKKLKSSYWYTLNNQFITHTHFANIEASIKKTKLDDNTEKKLLQEFAAFTPVITNPVLMAAKIKQGGEEVLKTSVKYAKEHGNTGQNTSQENLMMIYRGLQKLGNEELVEHFKNKIDKGMWEKIKIQSVWYDFLDAVRSKRRVDTTYLALKQELGLMASYKRTLKNQVITHMTFTHIEAVIKKTKLGDNTEKKLLQEFAVFTPVIANPELMAAKLKRGGKEVLKTSMSYANTRKGTTNSKLDNLTMIYRGLQELGDKELSEYFENEIDIDILQRIWQDFFDAVRSNNERYSYFSNEALRQELGFVNAYKQTLKNQVITYMLFANIEASIKKTKLDDNIAKKLLQEFAVFTPVIANSVLMAAKLKRGGEEVLDIAMYYANTRKGVTNSKRENLTMIYRGLQELGDKKLIEYFENKIDADQLQKIQSNPQRKQLEELWQEFFDAVRSKRRVDTKKWALLQELELEFAYKQTLKNQVIIHTYFTHIENAIEKEELDPAIAKKLLDKFAAFTPVIANPVLMVDKIKQGGEEVLDTAIKYVRKLTDARGIKLRNLTIIYSGLQELGNEAFIKYFEKEIGEDMLKKIKSKM